MSLPNCRRNSQLNLLNTQAVCKFMHGVGEPGCKFYNIVEGGP